MKPDRLTIVLLFYVIIITYGVIQGIEPKRIYRNTLSGRNSFRHTYVHNDETSDLTIFSRPILVRSLAQRDHPADPVCVDDFV